MGVFLGVSLFFELCKTVIKQAVTLLVVWTPPPPTI